MKRNLLIAALLFSSVFCFSQQNNFKHEIGINLFSMIADYDDIQAFTYHSEPFSGIAYKYHSRKHNFRGSVNYVDYSYNFTGIHYMKGEINILNFKTGIEKRIFSGDIQIILASDLGLSYFHDNYESSGDFIPDLYDGYYKNLSVNLYPTMGLNYSICKNLSASIESSFGFGHEVYNTRNNALTFWAEFYPISVLSLNCQL